MDQKDRAHYTPLLSDSDEAIAAHKEYPSDGEPATIHKRIGRRYNVFYLALVAVQTLLILALVAVNWFSYGKLNSAACSQVIYCKSYITLRWPVTDLI